MRSLQLLFRASPAGLLLLLCLQLRISGAQEDTTSREVLILNMKMPKTAAPGEDVNVTLRVETELRECMVIKAYLISSKPIDGPFNYIYTTCLCADYPRTLYWEFTTNSTVQVTAVVDIVREQNICPNDEAVIPIGENQFQVTGTLEIP